MTGNKKIHIEEVWMLLKVLLGFPVFNFYISQINFQHLIYQYHPHSSFEELVCKKLEFQAFALFFVFLMVHFCEVTDIYASLNFNNWTL
jgi:hypothetical protein